MTNVQKSEQPTIQFKANQKVKYVGVTIPQINLISGGIYIVADVTPFGAVKLKDVGGPVGMSLNPNQFEAVEEVLPAPLEELDSLIASTGSKVLGQEAFQQVQELIEEEPKPTQALKDLMGRKKSRLGKFSTNPGSAVVHYKAGSTFHITNLVHISVGTLNLEEVVAVTRKYERDGVFFEQTAHIPVEMFDKVVYRPLDTKVLDQEVVITYDAYNNSLVYPLTYSAKSLDLTRKI